MNRPPLSAAPATPGLAVSAAVAYDATLIADALGVQVQGGEGAVAMAGLIIVIAAVACGLRGLWPTRLRMTNG